MPTPPAGPLPRGQPTATFGSARASAAPWFPSASALGRRSMSSPFIHPLLRHSHEMDLSSLSARHRPSLVAHRYPAYQYRQSYVFVANHQGAMDIFLMFGYLGHQFRWMMKRSLVSIPFVGYACRRAHHIFVDHRSPSATAETIRAARFVLEQGMSLAVFPEGTRTRTGRIGKFHRGAFLLADELQIPIVPVTIDGSYEVLPRTHDIDFVHRHPLRLIIHQPIEPEGQGREDINQRTQQAYDIIRQSLPERYR